jgi:hypothetical protein
MDFYFIDELHDLKPGIHEYRRQNTEENP